MLLIQPDRWHKMAQPEPLSINISAARACFVRCDGCYNHFGKAPEVRTDTILEFLALGHRAGIKNVTLCGGDPLARRDIIHLITEIKALGFRVSLDTVGTALLGAAQTMFFGRHHVAKVEPDSLARLVDLIGIPLDGPDNETVALFRIGRVNLFDQLIDTLEILTSAKAAICINTVVHRFNLYELTELVATITRFPSIVKWQLFQFSPIGPLGYHNRQKFRITTEEFVAAVSTARGSAISGGFPGVIEEKTSSRRKYQYLLVDTDGAAWMPRQSSSEEWDELADATDQRIVLGNINNRGDHERILQVVLSKKNNIRPTATP
jgi:MoaA/NifB/PqqE/SkfB family radical SAM enzyme